MKKFFPIFLALFSILFFIAIISRNELHLKNSQSIFVKLQPVDPRSLIQGDYMVLNYDLFWDEKSLNQDDQIHNQSKVKAFALLDAQKRLIKTSLSSKTGIPLQLKNPNNQVQQLYPASNSFLFAEGLAKCYEQAQYAEFKLDKNGKMILASLKGEHLEDLNCESNKNWLNPS